MIDKILRFYYRLTQPSDFTRPVNRFGEPALLYMTNYHDVKGFRYKGTNVFLNQPVPYREGLQHLDALIDDKRFEEGV